MALEELTDLKGVWSELSKVWEKIEELKEKPWLSVAPRKIRQALDALVQQLRGFPTRLKSYASFEYVQATLKGYAKVYVYKFMYIYTCMCVHKNVYGGARQAIYTIPGQRCFELISSRQQGIRTACLVHHWFTYAGSTRTLVVQRFQN